MEELLCNSCSRPMIYKPNGAEYHRFDCVCGQIVTLGPYGRLTMGILPVLFPDRMDERSAVFQQFLDYRIREVTFGATIRKICGQITAAEAEEAISQIKYLVDVKRRELTESHWWERLRRFLHV